MALALVPVITQLNHQGDASGSLDVVLDDHMMLSSFQVSWNRAGWWGCGDGADCGAGCGDGVGCGAGCCGVGCGCCAEYLPLQLQLRRCKLSPPPCRYKP